MLEVHRPPMTFAFSHRELELLREALAYRVIDINWMRDELDRERDDKHRKEIASNVAALDQLQVKLEAVLDKETGS